eukprot:8234082-Pyramimonas_sp.AAC.1
MGGAGEGGRGSRGGMGGRRGGLPSLKMRAPNSVRTSASKLACQSCRCRSCAMNVSDSKKIMLAFTLARGMQIKRRQKNTH